MNICFEVLARKPGAPRKAISELLSAVIQCFVHGVGSVLAESSPQHQGSGAG